MVAGASGWSLEDGRGVVAVAMEIEGASQIWGKCCHHLAGFVWVLAIWGRGHGSWPMLRWKGDAMGPCCLVGSWAIDLPWMEKLDCWQMGLIGAASLHRRAGWLDGADLARGRRQLLLMECVVVDGLLMESNGENRRRWCDGRGCCTPAGDGFVGRRWLRMGGG
ncbi:hypothetical protein ACLOJK_028275 [Asimina triloba]